MKKMLILMAVAVVTANSVGCCCRRLCPWLTQGAYCGPTALAATPTQYAAPAPSYGSSWDPCQCAVVPYGGPMAAAPVGAPCPPMVPGAIGAPYAAPGAAMPYAPMAGVMPMMGGEPGCAYEPGCGEPYMGAVGYGGFGPMMMPSDCANCGIGYDGGFSSPTPESYVDPGPVAE